MKLLGILMQSQNDYRYKHLVMTYPQWQTEPDTIGEFGCKLTAYTNAYNLCYGSKSYKTLKEVNQHLIWDKGYRYLDAIHKTTTTEEAKKLCFKKESEILDNVLFSILNIEDCIRNYKGEIDIESKKDFYIIITPYKTTGHFSLIVSKDKRYLDSFDLKIKMPKEIIEVRKITFR